MKAVIAGLFVLALLTGCGSTNNENAPSVEPTFYSHTIVFGNHSSLIASGYNEYGQLGDGSIASPNSIAKPILVSTAVRFHGYASGANQAIAFANNSTLYVWGCNFHGRLGTGGQLAVLNSSTLNVPTSGGRAYLATPSPIKMSNSVRSVATGWNHSVAVVGNTVWAAGANSLGQLGNGGVNNFSDSNVWTQVSSGGVPLDRVVQVAAGGSHSLALRDDGTVWAWGDNLYGQLGYTTVASGTAAPTFWPVPRQVMLDEKNNVPLTNVKAIAAAGSYSLALLNDGRVFAWGYNAYRQLGNAAAPLYSFTPVPVQENVGTDVNPVYVDFHAVKISAGIMHVIALKADQNGNSTNQVYGWGFNERGQVGMGIDKPTSVPTATLATAVQGFMQGSQLTTVQDIYAFGTHSLARIDGNWYGWGDNGSGELGQVVPTDQIALKLTPVPYNPAAF